MILLDSDQILAAVKRSLENHVLPVLEDDFARVQIAAALKALSEVEHRLQQGDLCERINDDTATAALSLATQIRADAPDFADALKAAVAATPDEPGPRGRNRQLVSTLWELVKQNEGRNGDQLLALLTESAQQSAGQDAIWMCPEAVLSLT